ncbi:MAG TPA: NisI/SpaI family lantibiotic immunity lipoprotein [Caproicibacter sp.]|nr:NisI/SpaI family lantibiotic immunity lipoprotein [Caproicibacter sp.]
MKTKNFLLLLLCILLLAGTFGCSDYKDADNIGKTIENLCSDISEKIQSSKIKCTLNVNDATQIQYDGRKYQITNTQLSKDDIGKWTGIILQYAVLSSQYHVLAQRSITDESYTNSAILEDLGKSLPEKADLIVPFYDVYYIIGQKGYDEVAVLVGNHFYKAVPADNKIPDDKKVQVEREAVWKDAIQMDSD